MVMDIGSTGGSSFDGSSNLQGLITAKQMREILWLNNFSERIRVTAAELQQKMAEKCHLSRVVHNADELDISETFANQSESDNSQLLRLLDDLGYVVRSRNGKMYLSTRPTPLPRPKIQWPLRWPSFSRLSFR